MGKDEVDSRAHGLDARRLLVGHLHPVGVLELLHQRVEADSLDLYTLVQELEDTNGVAMSDEQAARIQTVGAAVDFVLDNVASDTAGPRP